MFIIIILAWGIGFLISASLGACVKMGTVARGYVNGAVVYGYCVVYLLLKMVSGGPGPDLRFAQSIDMCFRINSIPELFIFNI